MASPSTPKTQPWKATWSPTYPAKKSAISYLVDTAGTAIVDGQSSIGDIMFELCDCNKSDGQLQKGEMKKKVYRVDSEGEALVNGDSGGHIGQGYLDLLM